MVITKSSCYVSAVVAKPLWNCSARRAMLTENLSDPKRKERPMRMNTPTCGMLVAAGSRARVVDVIAA